MREVRQMQPASDAKQTTTKDSHIFFLRLFVVVVVVVVVVVPLLESKTNKNRFFAFYFSFLRVGSLRSKLVRSTCIWTLHKFEKTEKLNLAISVVLNGQLEIQPMYTTSWFLLILMAKLSFSLNTPCSKIVSVLKFSTLMSLFLRPSFFIQA